MFASSEPKSPGDAYARATCNPVKSCNNHLRPALGGRSRLKLGGPIATMGEEGVVSFGGGDSDALFTRVRGT